MTSKVYSYDDIMNKAQYEGGLDEALEWFSVDEVPDEIKTLWVEAKTVKDELDRLLDSLSKIMDPNEGFW